MGCDLPGEPFQTWISVNSQLLGFYFSSCEGVKVEDSFPLLIPNFLLLKPYLHCLPHTTPLTANDRWVRPSGWVVRPTPIVWPASGFTAQLASCRCHLPLPSYLGDPATLQVTSDRSRSLQLSRAFLILPDYRLIAIMHFHRQGNWSPRMQSGPNQQLTTEN